MMRKERRKKVASENHLRSSRSDKGHKVRGDAEAIDEVSRWKDGPGSCEEAALRCSARKQHDPLWVGARVRVRVRVQATASVKVRVAYG